MMMRVVMMVVMVMRVVMMTTKMMVMVMITMILNLEEFHPGGKVTHFVMIMVVMMMTLPAPSYHI